MRRRVRDLFRQFAGPVQVFHNQTAVLAGRLDRDIAHAEDALPEGLNHSYILNFGKLNNPNGLRSKPGFIAQLIAGDG